MSEVQNNLGEKFKETIAEAMKTGDFHALNTLVTDTVNDALREADFQANLSREATEKKVWNSQRNSDKYEEFCPPRQSYGGIRSPACSTHENLRSSSLPQWFL